MWRAQVEVEHGTEIAALVSGNQVKEDPLRDRIPSQHVAQLRTAGVRTCDGWNERWATRQREPDGSYDHETPASAASHVIFSTNAACSARTASPHRSPGTRRIIAAGVVRSAMSGTPARSSAVS